MSLKEIKLNLQLTTKKGLPIIIAGFIFWLIASIAGVFLPESIVVWVYIFGIGCIFPLGILVAQILKIDIFAKENPLGTLAGIIGGINLLNIPLILIVYFNEPSWLPFIVGLAVGAHFLPYVWIYDSKSYLFLSISTVLLAGLLVIFLIESIFVIVPICICIVYFITIICLNAENKQLIK